MIESQESPSSAGIITNPAIVSAAKSSQKGQTPSKRRSRKPKGSAEKSGSQPGTPKSAGFQRKDSPSSDLSDLEAELKKSIERGGAEMKELSLWSDSETASSVQTPKQKSKGGKAKSKANSGSDGAPTGTGAVVEAKSRNSKKSDTQTPRSKAKKVPRSGRDASNQTVQDTEKEDLKKLLFPDMYRDAGASPAPRKKGGQFKENSQPPLPVLPGVIAENTFAGSSFSHSPAPSSLPKPTGFKNTPPRSTTGFAGQQATSPSSLSYPAGAGSAVSLNANYGSYSAAPGGYSTMPYGTPIFNSSHMAPTGVPGGYPSAMQGAPHYFNGPVPGFGGTSPAPDMLSHLMHADQIERQAPPQPPPSVQSNDEISRDLKRILNK